MGKRHDFSPLSPATRTHETVLESRHYTGVTVTIQICLHDTAML